MPLTSQQCRQYAEDCIEMAEHAEKVNFAALHKMAEAWLRLSEELLSGERVSTHGDQDVPSTGQLQ